MNKFISGLVGLGLYDWTGMLIGLLIGSVLDAKFIPKPAAEKEVNLQLHYMMLVSMFCNVVMASGHTYLRDTAPVQYVSGCRFCCTTHPDAGRYVEAAHPGGSCLQTDRSQRPANHTRLAVAATGRPERPSGCSAELSESSPETKWQTGWDVVSLYRRKRPKAPPPPRKPAYSRTDSLYRKLGASPATTMPRSKAYYRLAKIHHPDRNQHSPMSVVRFRRSKKHMKAFAGSKVGDEVSMVSACACQAERNTDPG